MRSCTFQSISEGFCSTDPSRQEINIVLEVCFELVRIGAGSCLPDPEPLFNVLDPSLYCFLEPSIAVVYMLQCFNAGGDAYVCCPGQCAANPGQTPACEQPISTAPGKNIKQQSQRLNSSMLAFHDRKLLLSIHGTRNRLASLPLNHLRGIEVK